jgi:hypothetical protein
MRLQLSLPFLEKIQEIMQKSRDLSARVQSRMDHNLAAEGPRLGNPQAAEESPPHPAVATVQEQSMHLHS